MGSGATEGFVAGDHVLGIIDKRGLLADGRVNETFGMANMQDKGSTPLDRQCLFLDVEQLEGATVSQLAEEFSEKRCYVELKNIAIAVAALGPDAREASWSRSTRFTRYSLLAAQRKSETA